MGTRSLTIVLDEGNDELCVLYRQMDGYPEGHGKELRDFLRGMKLVNGIRDYKDTKLIGKRANGMGCLAAQIVAHFKTEVGEFYLYPVGTRGIDEDYVYTVSKKGNRILVNCKSVDRSYDTEEDKTDLYWTY